LTALVSNPRHSLIENVFVSRPDDFKRYGLYTCRFYVDGNWVEVICDTRLPCISDEYSDVTRPVYGRSVHPAEMWVPFAEKAYAKAVGSYEAIPNVKIPDILTHLTGGSVQQLNMHNPTTAMDPNLWRTMKSMVHHETLILAVPISSTSSSGGKKGDDEAGGKGGEDTVGEPSDGGDGSASAEEPAVKVDFFLENRIYSVIECRNAGDFELVLLHNPWAIEPDPWKGEMGNTSHDWELYPDIRAELESNPELPWALNNPNGYFWMTFQKFKELFGTVYLTKIFPSQSFDYYCIHNEWKGVLAGGPLHTIRDKSIVVKDAQESKTKSFHRVSGVHYCKPVVLLYLSFTRILLFLVNVVSTKQWRKCSR
jgi:Calpain family cysteine protease